MPGAPTSLLLELRGEPAAAFVGLVIDGQSGGYGVTPTDMPTESGEAHLSRYRLEGQ